MAPAPRDTELRDVDHDVRARIAADLRQMDPRGRGAYHREVKRLIQEGRDAPGRAAHRKAGAGMSAAALGALAALLLISALVGGLTPLSGALIVGAACAALLSLEHARAAASARAADSRADPASCALEAHLAALSRISQRRPAHRLDILL